MITRNDPRGEPAWRLLLAVLAVTLGAALLSLRLPRGEDAVAPAGLLLAAAVSWTAAWALMARFRWLTVTRRRPWMVVLSLAWLCVLTGGTAWQIVGFLLALPFLLRWQTGLQLLAGRRRVWSFLLLGPLLVLTVWPGLGTPDGRLGAILGFTRLGVQVFLLSGLLTLVLGMRLHFLRLRPKLFVTGVLVGVIPLLLLTVFGLVLLYASLGGSRANRAADLLHVWAESYAEGRVPAAMEAPEAVWRESAAADGPQWMADLVGGLRVRRDEPTAPPEPSRSVGLSASEGEGGNIRFEMDEDRPQLPSLAASQDTTFWFMAEGSVWLTHLQDPGPGAAQVEAVPMDQATVEAIARLLRVDVITRGVGGENEALIGGIRSLRAHYEPPGGDGGQGEVSFWDRPMFFGGAFVPAPVLDEHGLADAMLMLELQTSLRHLTREFFNPDQNVFNIAMMVAMGLLAVLLLLTGLAALMLSLRITGGIVEAVKALHRGTRRLAAGDLDTMIEVQSEDEFGDLADSFNEMTVAVKQGRQDAIARERLQQEMSTARAIQERLLPHDQPLLAGWEVTGVSIPSLQVGGDYFDFLQPGDGRLGIAIGDVSGKGVPAALLMSNLQACLKGQVLHPAPVAATVSRVNDLLAESTDPHMFATFFYGELDGASGRFTSTNAGHEPALVVRRDGTVEWLVAGGLLLGMFAGQPYDQAEVDLGPGDVLVLYTDGITEAGAPLILPGEDRPEPDDEDSGAAGGAEGGPDWDDEDLLFGEERLARAVVAARERSAVGIREAVLAAVQRHLDGRPQGDDITLVVVKRGEEQPPARGA